MREARRARSWERESFEIGRGVMQEERDFKYNLLLSRHDIVSLGILKVAYSSLTRGSVGRAGHVIVCLVVQSKSLHLHLLFSDQIFFFFVSSLLDTRLVIEATSMAQSESPEQRKHCDDSKITPPDDPDRILLDAQGKQVASRNSSHGPSQVRHHISSTMHSA